MKSLHPYVIRYTLITCCLVALTQISKAQTEADALMIPKNYFCAASMYSTNYWTNYWEGTLKRNNLNLGKVTTNAYMLGGNYGITNKLDVLFSAPYVTTKATAGTLKGQKGVQDLNIALKWLPYQTEIGKGIFGAYVILSGSIPLSNYEPDFLPLSIGLHSETASLRGLVNYQVGRFFVAGAAQYTIRGDVTLDRQSYYTTTLINSNRVYMPNTNNWLVSTGYRSLKLNVEAIFSQGTTLGGFDIRRNDMPFPSNTMNMTTAGGLVKYSFDAVTGLELTAGGNYVLKGRNVGQATTIFGGVNYVFDFSPKNHK